MIHATLILRTEHPPISNRDKSLDEYFLLDADISGAIADKKGHGMELAGKWRVVESRRDLELGDLRTTHIYRLEQLP